MFNFLKTFEKTMAAAAFAEAGEFDSAKQYLAGTQPANQRVLLGADENDISPRVIQHALSLCSRLESSLEILQIISPHALGTAIKTVEERSQQLAAFKEKLNRLGILYQYAIRDNELVSELAAYTLKRRDILVVVMQQLKTNGKPQSESDIARHFNCPVALIEA